MRRRWRWQVRPERNVRGRLHCSEHVHHHADRLSPRDSVQSDVCRCGLVHLDDRLHRGEFVHHRLHRRRLLHGTNSLQREHVHRQLHRHWNLHARRLLRRGKLRRFAPAGLGLPVSPVDLRRPTRRSPDRAADLRSEKVPRFGAFPGAVRGQVAAKFGQSLATTRASCARVNIVHMRGEARVSLAIGKSDFRKWMRGDEARGEVAEL